MEESKDVQMTDESVTLSTSSGYHQLDMTMDPLTGGSPQHVFPTLKSANITTEIVSMCYKLPQAVQILRLLSRNGYQFARKNFKHLETFCASDIIPEYILRVSETGFQRPTSS
jgi:hypothetical protein